MTADLTALLVDDDEFVLNTVAHLLRQLGVMRVQTATDGGGALRAVAPPGRFDLIVCDLMLPGVDGVEFLRTLAARQTGAALVLISALDESVLRSVALLSRERGLRVLGALRKPVRPEALAELLAPLRQAAPVAAAEQRDATPGPDDAALLRAIERGDLGWHAQPRVGLVDRELRGLALRLQWARGVAPPLEQAQVFALARRHRLTAALVEHLLASVVRAAADCWQQGVHVPLVAGMPGAALRRLDLPDLLERQLRSAGAMPERFGLGLPESELPDDSTALDVLSRLRMRGMGVCIDEFGGRTGYARLQRLPVTAVRVDARLLHRGERARKLLEHAIANATALGFCCVADGVESDEQAETLLELGCESMVGPLAGPLEALDDAIGRYGGSRASPVPGPA